MILKDFLTQVKQKKELVGIFPFCSHITELCGKKLNGGGRGFEPSAYMNTEGG